MSLIIIGLMVLSVLPYFYIITLPIRVEQKLKHLASNWVYGFVCKGKKFPTRMLMVQSTFFNVVGDLFEKCFIDLDSEDVTQFQSGSFRSRDTIFMSTVCPKINLL